MLKKSTAAVLLTAVMNLPLSAFTLPTCDFSSVTQPVSLNDEALVHDNLLQSQELLSLSQNLLTISQTLMNSASETDLAYINAMLRLSDDIGSMADRIGTMADRIVATELQIGIMADRILETIDMQNQTLGMTQANLLKAQENFNNLLVQLAP